MKHKNVVNSLGSLFLIIVIMASCVQKEQDGISVIDIAGNMGNTIDVKLSDFADSVSYIPLETKPECLVETSYKVVSTDDLIFVADGEKPLFVFNKEGRFIRSIGSIGNGPGEFRNVYQFHLDEENQEVYVFNRNAEFLKYKWSGEFIEKIEFPHRAIGYERLVNGDFFFFLAAQQFSDSVYFKSYFTDKDLEEISLVPENSLERTHYGISVGANIWHGEQYNFMQSELCDTIYKIINRQLEPRYFVDFGALRFTPEMMNDRDNIESNLDTYVTNYGVFATGNYWNFSFRYETKGYLCMLDKQTNEIRFASELDRHKNGLINDIDGGPGFDTYWMTSGNEWYQSLQAIDIRDSYESGEFDKSDIKDRVANREIKRIADGLKEDDNPVIMVVHRKSDPELW